MMKDNISSDQDNNWMTKATSIILFLILLIAFPWSGNWHVIAWDIFGYYLYLPELFIWHNPGITNYEFIHELINKYEVSTTFYQVHEHANGNYLIQYPIGMAIEFLPAFLIGHAIAYFTSAPIDGLSPPYEWAILIEHFVITGIGIWLAGKVLLKFFKDSISSFLLIMLVMGTNFFSQAFYGAPSTHIFLFTLHAIFILLTFKWFEKPTKRLSLIYGMLLGLIALTRATDILVVLIPALWKIKDKASLLQRIQDLLKGKLRIPSLIALTGFVISIFPQLLFWKIFAGEWFYYSYKNAGEGFEFLHPYTMDFLFSFRKGWLIYTPFMWLLIPGLILIFKQKFQHRWMILTFIVIDIYILSSWSCWWYAGGFSQRPLIQAYILFVIPIGYVIQWVMMQKWILRWMLFLFSCFTLVLNQFQTWQATKWLLHPSRMTAAYYFKVFGQTTFPMGLDSLLLVRRTENPLQDVFRDSTNYHIQIHNTTDFEQPNSYFEKNITGLFGYKSLHSLQLSDRHDFSDRITIPYDQLSGNADHAWIRVRFKYFTNDSLSKVQPTAVMGFLNRKGEHYDYNGIRLEDVKAQHQFGSWNTYETTFLSPEVRSSNDRFLLYFWIRGKGTFFVDDIEIISFVKN